LRLLLIIVARKSLPGRGKAGRPAFEKRSRRRKAS
jgi:hypothetical protein